MSVVRVERLRESIHTCTGRCKVGSPAKNVRCHPEKCELRACHGDTCPAWGGEHGAFAVFTLESGEQGIYCALALATRRVYPHPFCGHTAAVGPELSTLVGELAAEWSWTHRKAEDFIKAYAIFYNVQDTR